MMTDELKVLKMAPSRTV